MPIPAIRGGLTIRKSQIEARLAACLSQAPSGIQNTEVEGVRLFWTILPTPPAPLIYDAGIVIVLRGRKEGFLGEQSFIYDEDNYMVLTLPMPFLCGHHASREEPLYGLFVDVSRNDLSGLLGQMSAFGRVAPKAGLSALAPAPVGDDMRAATHRLLSALDDRQAGRVIGPALRREVLFHALRGPRGPALAAYAQQTGDDGKLDGLIEQIRRDIARPVFVETMADSVAMSVSTFHRVFRKRTGQSPLQYVKRLRLHAARDLIAFEGVRVAEAARRVGYESTSQFSREYRRHFNEPATATRDFHVMEESQ